MSDLALTDSETDSPVKQPFQFSYTRQAGAAKNIFGAVKPPKPAEPSLPGASDPYSSLSFGVRKSPLGTPRPQQEAGLLAPPPVDPTSAEGISSILRSPLFSFPTSQTKPSPTRVKPRSNPANKKILGDLTPDRRSSEPAKTPPKPASIVKDMKERRRTRSILGFGAATQSINIVSDESDLSESSNSKLFGSTVDDSSGTIELLSCLDAPADCGETITLYVEDSAVVSNITAEPGLPGDGSAPSEATPEIDKVVGKEKPDNLVDASMNDQTIQVNKDGDNTTTSPSEIHPEPFEPIKPIVPEQGGAGLPSVVEGEPRRKKRRNKLSLSTTGPATIVFVHADP